MKIQKESLNVFLKDSTAPTRWQSTPKRSTHPFTALQSELSMEDGVALCFPASHVGVPELKYLISNLTWSGRYTCFWRKSHCHNLAAYEIFVCKPRMVPYEHHDLIYKRYNLWPYPYSLQLVKVIMIFSGNDTVISVVPFDLIKTLQMFLFVCSKITWPERQLLRKKIIS